MKRLLSLIFILIVATAQICAGTPVYLHDYSSGSLSVFGYMDSYWLLSVEPLITERGSSIGMPFDLLGTDVAYISDESPLGRTIGYWTLIVNPAQGKAWHLKIHADALEKGNSSIDYHLIFSCAENEDWIVHSSGNNYTYFPSGTSASIGSTDDISIIRRQIRFMLDYNGGADKDFWEEGDYNATVEFVLEGN